MEASSPITRHNAEETRLAWFSLSQTQRRLAHRYKREAEAAEKRDDYRWFAHCKTEANRLWREAKWNLSQARSW